MNQRLTALACSILLACGMLFARGAQEQPVTTIRSLDPENRLSIAIDAGDDPIVLDSRHATDTNSILVASAISEGLTSYDPKTSYPVPAIAESWTTSEDGLTWEFTLRPDARFSDGTPITASDFIDTWFSLFDNANDQISVASLLDVISGFEPWRNGTGAKRHVGLSAPSPYTLRITLDTPVPYLPMLLSNTGFAVVHPSLRKNKMPMGTISSGPFVLASDADGVLHFQRNLFYWDDDAPKADYLDIHYGDNNQEIAKLYQQGDIHWSLAFIPRASQHGKDAFFSPLYATSFYYFSAPGGPYADSRVRKALHDIIDWDVVRTLSREPFTTDVLVPNSTAMAPDTPSDARALLADAGYPNGEGLPTLMIAIHRGSQLEQSAEYLAQMWSDTLGLTVILDIVPLSVYVSNPELTPYHVAFITWIGDYFDPTSFLSMWRSDSTLNIANYQDPDFDAIMGAAMSEWDLEKRTQLLIEAEEHLLETDVVVPISNNFASNFVRTDLIEGWYDNPLNIHPLKEIGIIGR